MKRRRWSAQEIHMLQERYAKEGPVLLALEMGRSADSVSSFAHRCGLRNRRWLERREAGATETEPVRASCNAESSS
jgi:acetoin utilization deacetylase AcuC-like enzyme